ncbi:MAG TPA: DUF4093 domain-containing protein [Candidatus Butyricicoccus avistercoris]|uniref:DUF4093 domain-containing protein n=1 Tax=Candidatus Butyricicoccus avistercoris TaxID=2838518 RepID=A0A9D1PJX6_9FIRM|nr:DUF4093 domain-containing protein [Candidatus Butyricicoccus avistercoris]
MIEIKEAIIVEGRYDIQTLKQCVNTVILQTGGFRIFKDKERLQMIRKIAQKRGILILTDSDGAGLVIRNFLKGAIPTNQVKHAYIPEILGKESRKRHASKAGTLGVEGMSQDVLKNALISAGATILGDEQKTIKQLVKADLFALGLSGQSGSEQKRKALLKKLNLPQYLSSNALLDFLNAVSNKDEIFEIIKEIENNT